MATVAETPRGEVAAQKGDRRGTDFGQAAFLPLFSKASKEVAHEDRPVHGVGSGGSDGRLFGKARDGASAAGPDHPANHDRL